MRANMTRGLRWTWATLGALACVLVAAYGFVYLRRPFDPGDPFMARFALTGLAVPMHFFGASLALLLVPVQASATVRRRWPRLHRIGGGLSVGGILAAGAGGLVMAFGSHRGLATGPAFAMLALTWLVVTALGVAHVVRGDIAAHRRWMMRCIALTTSAITLRLMLPIGAAGLRLPFDTVYIFAAWSCWPVNLLLCEAWLRRRPRRRTPGATVPSAGAAIA